jgi:peptide/nickel transport system permease protein
MKQFILRRLLLAVVTLIGVSWLIFAIMWMIPGDGAIAILGDGANPERVAALRAQMGLNDPWYVQYGRWAKDTVRGDLDTSLFIGS